MKMNNLMKSSNNLIYMYQTEERLSNRQLAGRLGLSIGKARTVRSVRRAPYKQLEALAEFEGITVRELSSRYGGKCA